MRLTKLAGKLEQIPGEIAILFRDDDATSRNSHLEQLLAIFGAYNAPLHLAVIPAQVTSETAVWLRRLKQEEQIPLEFGQHGYTHSNYGGEAPPLFEFGPARSYRQQLQDIQAGQALMAAHFETDFAPVFTPPFNAVDANTLTALSACGFSVLSVDAPTRMARERYPFHEVSINLDPVATYLPEVTYKRVALLAKEIWAAAQTHRYLAFNLHHKLFTADFLSLLREIVAMCSELANGRCYTFRAYADAHGSSPLFPPFTPLPPPGTRQRLRHWAINRLYRPVENPWQANEK